MNTADVIKMLKRIVADLDCVSTPAADLNDGDELIADLGLDSLDYATVLVTCESELGVSVMEDDIDWRSVRTIADLAGLLERAPVAE